MFVPHFGVFNIHSHTPEGENPQFLQQVQKSYFPSHSHPVQKCKCRECNTFAIVQIHVQMFQAMPFKR